MKLLGMLGGMSWESTQLYYQQINQGIRQHLGGLHSAPILLYSVDFARIKILQHQEDWAACADILGNIAVRLEEAGAKGLVICTNTMHKVADQIASRIHIPILHIADATGQQLSADGIRRVGLLGTRFTMEQDFYRQRLIDRFGLDVIIPTEEDRARVHQVIYDELCQGLIRPESRQQYQEVIARLAAQGAQAVILGCTEITLLIQPEHTAIPVYDTTALHVQSAINWLLAT